MSADRIIVVTRYRDDYDTRGKKTRTTWTKFAKWVALHPQGPKRSAGAFIAGAMSGKGRKLEDLEGREAATIDLDSNVPGDVDQRLADALPGVAFVRATSSSATQANPKCRVLVPFSRTVTEAEYRNVMSWLLDETGLRPFADPVSTRPVQLMYRVTDTGANLVESTIRDGEFLDVEGVLLLAPDVASSQARDEAGGNALTERMDGQTDERPCTCVGDRVARFLELDEDAQDHPAFYNLAGDVWELLWRGHTIGNALTDDGEAVEAYRAHCAAKHRDDDARRVIANTATRTAGRTAT